MTSVALDQRIDVIPPFANVQWRRMRGVDTISGFVTSDIARR